MSALTVYTLSEVRECNLEHLTHRHFNFSRFFGSFLSYLFSGFLGGFLSYLFSSLFSSLFSGFLSRLLGYLFSSLFSGFLGSFLSYLFSSLFSGFLSRLLGYLFSSLFSGFLGYLFSGGCCHHAIFSCDLQRISLRITSNDNICKANAGCLRFNDFKRYCGECTITIRRTTNSSRCDRNAAFSYYDGCSKRTCRQVVCVYTLYITKRGYIKVNGRLISSDTSTTRNVDVDHQLLPSCWGFDFSRVHRDNGLTVTHGCKP